MPAVTWDTIGLYRDDKSSYIVPYIVEKCNINKKINKKEHIVEWKIVKMVLDVCVLQNDKLNRSLNPIRSY